MMKIVAFFFSEKIFKYLLYTYAQKCIMKKAHSEEALIS